MLIPGDDNREIVVAGDHETTVDYCVAHFIQAANRAIREHGQFYVALSGGSTPKSIFQKIAAPPYHDQIKWSSVHLFWSDERSVSPNDSDSNFNMAMEAGLKNLPIPKEQIHRMVAEDNIEENAALFEKTIKEVLKEKPFDLIMLGMGEDGHTASLFPGTNGLKVEDRLVIANYIPQKDTWRMTLTYPCLNMAKQVVIYVLGESKKEMLKKAFTTPFNKSALPIQKVGTSEIKSLWIADDKAALLL